MFYGTINVKQLSLNIENFQQISTSFSPIVFLIFNCHGLQFLVIFRLFIVTGGDKILKTLIIKRTSINLRIRWEERGCSNAYDKYKLEYTLSKVNYISHLEGVIRLYDTSNTKTTETKPSSSLNEVLSQCSFSLVWHRRSISRSVSVTSSTARCKETNKQTKKEEKNEEEKEKKERTRKRERSAKEGSNFSSGISATEFENRRTSEVNRHRHEYLGGDESGRHRDEGEKSSLVNVGPSGRRL